MAIGTDFTRDISRKYCALYGQLAVEMGFVSERQLMAAFQRQAEEAARGQPHRLGGQILFDEGWISSEQIEEVLKALFRANGEIRHRTEARAP